MVAEVLPKKCRFDYWVTDRGQSGLLRRAQKGASHLPEGKALKGAPWRKDADIDTAAQLSELSYTTSTRASQVKSYLSPVSPTDEWFEIELTADCGACDTVIPKQTCALVSQ